MGRKQRVSPALKVMLVGALVLVALAVLVAFLLKHDVAVLNPQGIIAAKERQLFIVAAILGVFVVVPVFAMTFFIVWRYRDTNKRPKKYSPDWDRSVTAESLWWGIPIAIILVLSAITWRSSHQLDPFKTLESDKKPLTIQVVALQWKWLFIYPEQDIATVNFVQFPEDRPVNFVITADAPMNSFWIPELGGQIYAMSGMTTKLHLMASQPGDFAGSSANISGEGFADMHFTARASTQVEFDDWVKRLKDYDENSTGHIETILAQAGYNSLAEPGTADAPRYYRRVEPGLYNRIVMRYLMPDMTGETSSRRTDWPKSTRPSMELH